MADDTPYLARNWFPVETPSSVLVSSSKYLNNAALRDWLAMILLRKNGSDMPPQVEMHQLLPILDSLRDYDRIEQMFEDERKVNPELDAWFKEGFYSTYSIDDFKEYAPGSLGGTFYSWITEGNYEIQITPWVEPKTQFQFYNLRSGQTHDFEHILCGGGFNFMGELVPYWYRLTNVFKFIKNPELAAEVSLIQIFGSLRYTVRTILHYPQIWPTAVNAIQRGMKVGQESDALFMKKLEPAFHLPLEEARAFLGVRGAVDVDTEREGAFWASDGKQEHLLEAAE
ncbi:MAG: Coq4 family protein [Novosphingobium sp.]|nr:Coq4 family protein [Novosphingobium sp.]